MAAAAVAVSIRRRLAIVVTLLLASAPQTFAYPAAVEVHAYDIYPVEIVTIFDIIKHKDESSRFLEVYNKNNRVPDEIYADVRYQYPEIESRVRPIIVDVQQKARRLTPGARRFLAVVSAKMRSQGCNTIDAQFSS